MKEGAQTHALDPLTGRETRLFNLQKQNWKRHFKWSVDGTHIVGRTACGGATVTALQMNHATIVTARHHWVIAGWHPPKDDVKQAWGGLAIFRSLKGETDEDHKSRNIPD